MMIPVTLSNAAAAELRTLLRGTLSPELAALQRKLALALYRPPAYRSKRLTHLNTTLLF